MQTSAMKVYFQIAECSLSYAKIIIFFYKDHIGSINLKIKLYKSCKSKEKTA